MADKITTELEIRYRSESLKKAKRDAEAFTQSLSGEALTGGFQRLRDQISKTAQRSRLPVSTPPSLPNSLTGGVLQASGFSPYFHEGRFQGRRYMGALAGRAAQRGFSGARQMAGGLAATPFTGSAGLQTALAGLPVVGGAAAGVLQTAQAASQQSLAYQRQRARLGAAFDSAQSGGGRYRALGQRFGLAPTELDQLSAQMSESAGQSVGGLARRGQLGAALAANRALGLDMGTAGTLERAGREGLSSRSGSDTLKQTFAEGIAQGLGRSDIANYLRQQAADIKAFARTGIPIANPESLFSLGSELAGRAGLGTNVGLQQALALKDNISARGMSRDADDPLTFALMRASGYSGGGIGEYMEAKDRIADPSNLSPEIIDRLLRQVNRDAGGQEAGQFAQNVALQRLGLPMTFAKSRDLTAGSPSTELGQRTTAANRKAMARARQAQQSLFGAGQAIVSRGVRDDAKLNAQRINMGGQLLPSMQNLESATTNTTAAFATLAPQLEAFSKNVAAIAQQIPGFFQAVKEGLNDWVPGVNLD